MTRANYSIVSRDDDTITIRDMGPWNKHKTVTNDAELVVAELYFNGYLGSRRLLYYDSENQLSELLHKNGEFLCYACVPEPKGESSCQS